MSEQTMEEKARETIIEKLLDQYFPPFRFVLQGTAFYSEPQYTEGRVPAKQLAADLLALLEQGGWLRCKEDCASLKEGPIPVESHYEWVNCGLPCTCGNPMKALAKETK